MRPLHHLLNLQRHNNMNNNNLQIGGGKSETITEEIFREFLRSWDFS